MDGAWAADSASATARSASGKASSIRPSTHNVRASKISAAARQQRVRLQISLGSALIWAKGYHAAETSAAFARTRE